MSINESLVRRLAIEQTKSNRAMAHNPENKVLDKVNFEQNKQNEAAEAQSEISIEDLRDETIADEEARRIARGYRLRCNRFKKELPFVADVAGLNFSVSPHNPDLISFNTPDGLTTATVENGEAFAELGLRQERDSMIYESKNLPQSKPVHLKREVFATSDGDFAEYYSISQYASSELRTMQRRGVQPDTSLEQAIARDFVESHPGYELDDSGSGFFRTEISPEETFGDCEPDGFKQTLAYKENRLGGIRERNKESEAFAGQSVGDLSDIRTYGDFGNVSRKFADNALVAANFVKKAAAYAKH